MSTFALPIALAVAATVSVAGPAAADSGPSAPPTDVQLVTFVNGVWVPVSDALEEASLLDLEPVSARDAGVVTPNLIDWNQWFGCFSLNNEDDVFAEYVFWWDGEGQDVRLKCGNEYWGYKHIRSGHEADWQNKLNAARAAGWNIGPVANGGSWDDFMSEAAAVSILWPDPSSINNNPSNVTTCVIGNLGFFNLQTSELVYQFNAKVIFANDSDRLITAYPTSGASC